MIQTVAFIKPDDMAVLVYHVTAWVDWRGNEVGPGFGVPEGPCLY